MTPKYHEEQRQLNNLTRKLMENAMDTMNSRIDFEEHPPEISYEEWLGQLPSDVSIDVYNMGYRSYPETPQDSRAQKFLDDIFAAIKTEENFGLDRQVGGRHYKDLKIQPIEFCFANNLSPIATLIIKYITVAGQRDASGKSLREDLEKSLHCHEIWLDLLDKYEP